MRPITAKRLIAILIAHGFELSRQKGSHAVYHNGDGVMVAVPLHGKSKPIYVGTLMAIVKQSRIPKEKFE